MSSCHKHVRLHQPKSPTKQPSGSVTAVESTLASLIVFNDVEGDIDGDVVATEDIDIKMEVITEEGSTVQAEDDTVQVVTTEDGQEIRLQPGGTKQKKCVFQPS
jgi:hypothetical protein